MDSAWTVCPISDPAPTNEKKKQKKPCEIGLFKIIKFIWSELTLKHL